MHPVQIAIEHLATTIETEENSAEFAIWSVAALASRLRLPVLIGEDASPGEGRTLVAEAADFEPVPAGAPAEPETEEPESSSRKLLQFPKAFDEE